MPRHVLQTVSTGESRTPSTPATLRKRLIVERSGNFVTRIPGTGKGHTSVSLSAEERARAAWANLGVEIPDLTLAEVRACLRTTNTSAK